MLELNYRGLVAQDTGRFGSCTDDIKDPRHRKRSVRLKLSNGLRFKDLAGLTVSLLSCSFDLCTILIPDRRIRVGKSKKTVVIDYVACMKIILYRVMTVVFAYFLIRKLT